MQAVPPTFKSGTALAAPTRYVPTPKFVCLSVCLSAYSPVTMTHQRGSMRRGQCNENKIRHWMLNGGDVQTDKLSEWRRFIILFIGSGTVRMAASRRSSKVTGPRRLEVIVCIVIIVVGVSSSALSGIIIIIIISSSSTTTTSRHAALRQDCLYPPVRPRKPRPWRDIPILACPPPPEPSIPARSRFALAACRPCLPRPTVARPPDRRPSVRPR